jgi:hypothetical protein
VSTVAILLLAIRAAHQRIANGGMKMQNVKEEVDL